MLAPLQGLLEMALTLFGIIGSAATASVPFWLFVLPYLVFIAQLRVLFGFRYFAPVTTLLIVGGAIYAFFDGPWVGFAYLVVTALVYWGGIKLRQKHQRAAVLKANEIADRNARIFGSRKAERTRQIHVIDEMESHSGTYNLGIHVAFLVAEVLARHAELSPADRKEIILKIQDVSSERIVARAEELAILKALEKA